MNWMNRLKRAWLSGQKSAAVGDVAARTRRAALGLEVLEGRAMPAVLISGLNTGTGEVTFTGDGAADALTLSRWETSPGSGTFVLRHNLSGGGLNSDIDLDASAAGDQTLTLGTGSARNIGIDLGAGTDTLTIGDSWAFDHKVTFVGGAGTDALVGGNAGNAWAITDVTTLAGTLGLGADNLSWSGVETLTGGTGNDAITGEDAARNWNFVATHTYSDGTTAITFSGMEVMQGGSDVDQFTIAVAVSGAVNGGGGNDTFSFPAAATVSGGLSGGDGDDTFTIGAALASSITGDAGNDTVIIGAALTGNASGGTGDDVFSIGAAVTGTLTGDAGNDTFNVTAPANVSGGLSGGDDNDTFTVDAALDSAISGDDGNDVVTVNAAMVGSISGGVGNDVVTIGAALTGNGSGGAGGDLFTVTAAVTGALSGDAGDDAFDLSGAGTVSGALDGGADDDTFTLPGATTAGSVFGGTGSDTLNYAGRTAAVVVLLNGSSADGFSGTANGLTGGFATIDALVGSSNMDALTGLNVNSTWALDGTASYSDGANSVAFSAFESLTGGSADDTFQVRNNTAFTGTVTGSGGINSVDYSDDSNTSAIDVSVSGANAGSVSGAFTFTGIANLKGGSGDDTFSFASDAAGVTGTVDGQEGRNTLSYAGYTTSVRVSLAANSATGTAGITNFVNVTGGSGNDILIGDASANVLNGGAGNDIIFGGGGDDTITGGAGNDIVVSIGAVRVEGTSIAVSGSGSDAEDAPGALSYAWQVFKNGGASPFATGSGSDFSFTPDDAGSYRIVLTVSDGDGGSASAEQTISVSNAASVSGNILSVSGAGVPGGSQFILVPPGSFAIFTDLTGDGKGDVVVVLPNLILVVDGATGRFLALSLDVDGDGFRELMLFNLDGTTTTVNTKTGIVMTV